MPGTVVPDPSFRHWQAVSDLVAHVKPLLPPSFGALAHASGLTIVQTGEAVQLLRDDHFTFSRDETFALLDGLETLANAQGPGFDLAVVVLLADLLQTRQASGTPGAVWGAAQGRLRDWPETLRAAVANGLARASDLDLIAQPPPAAEDRQSRAPETIAEPLLRIARAMRPDELLEVAAQAEDMDAALDALKHLIRHLGGIFTDAGAGPVERAVTLVADAPGAPGFEGCTALLLLNALHSGDRDGQVARRWSLMGGAYCALRPSARDPVLAAVRHLYETWPAFAETSPLAFETRFAEGTLIPVVHDLT